MAELPSLVEDLALILVVAGFVTLLFKKLKQPLVLGYIVAGFLVSPHMPYLMSVVDKSDIQTWADILHQKDSEDGLFSHCGSKHDNCLYDDIGDDCGLLFWVEEDGLYLPWRYVSHEFYHYYL